MAERGAIVRNRSVLRYLGQETVMLLDKTGTLTTGTFRLIEGLQAIPQSQWTLLKALASTSIHPLSKAVKEAIPGPCAKFDSVEEIPGQGLIGSIGPEIILMGSKALLESYGCACPSAGPSEHSILTYIYFGNQGEIAYPLALGDKLRGGVKDMVSALTPLPLMVVSGDGRQTTAKVAELCGISLWRACCTPHEKKNIVAQLRQEGHIVAMVGDGINDAPALTAAHIGISAASAADISIQVSDILLTTDRMQVIPEIHKLACRGRRIIHQNIFWAFFYNSAGILWAAAGALTPLVAAFAMIASSLFVIGNARRI
jgi:Cu2+-exporting ATPase